MSIDDATPQDWDALRQKHPELVAKWGEYREKYPDDPIDDRLPVEDPVNNPLHYNMGGVECIEGIESSMSPNAFLGYLKGNCMKYLWRYDYKGKPVEDLEKAQWYLNLLIDRVK